MNIGHVIRRRRNAKNLTLAHIAAIVDSDPGNLSKIERGLQAYTPSMLSAIASALGTTVSELAAEAELPAIEEVDAAKHADPSEREERDLLRHYWKLDDAERASVRHITAQMAKASHLHPRRA